MSRLAPAIAARALAVLIPTILLSSSSASAALTSSEKGQIKDFVNTARAENANKVRSLVARTDLTPEESTSVLTDALVAVPWSDQRGAFLKELVFGGASAASRPVLTLATVKAVVARAESIYQRYVGGLDHETRARDELLAIYGWLDATIANAGKPTTQSHDAAAGIPAATYDDCSKVIAQHIEQNARWLKGDGVVPDTIGRVRAQAQVALVDMLPDGLTRRVDAADRLALKGARRKMLTDWGILFADAGKVDEAKGERTRQILTRLPGARTDLALVYAGEDRGGPIRARGGVVYVVPGTEKYPFVDETAPGTYDPTTSAIAHDLAVVAAKRALDNRPELKAQSERDANAASGDLGRLLGRPRAPSVDHVLGGAIHALLIDAPKAIDLATARAIGSRPETGALLSDAIGALAAFAEDKDAKGPKLDVGKSGGFINLSTIRLAPNGVAVAFNVDGHSWTIDRASPSYQVMGLRRDGAVIAVGQLGSVKALPREGSQWAESGYTFVKLRGAPRVAISSGADKATGPNVKLLGGGTEGFDVVTATPPGQDYTIEGELVVQDGAGGLAFRTQSTKKGFRGGLLVVTPGGTTTLSVLDDSGETNLTAPISPSPSGSVPVKISLAGKNVEATVGKATLKGTLPDSMGSGDVALIAKRNASVEVSGFTLKRR
jgi:hypothetical protein